jgi:hypothetical protein
MALAPLALTATPAAAQEEEPTTMEACTATVLPSQVEAGQTAERLSISLSSAIGEVSEFTTAEETAGLSVADAADLPASEMAAEEEEQEPIEMADTGDSVTIWLNTADAQAGTYEFTLKGADGECTGSIEVTDSGGR